MIMSWESIDEANIRARQKIAAIGGTTTHSTYTECSPRSPLQVARGWLYPRGWLYNGQIQAVEYEVETVYISTAP